MSIAMDMRFVHQPPSAREQIDILCGLINKEIIPIGGTAQYKHFNMVSVIFGTSQPAILNRERATEYFVWLEAGNRGTPDDFATRPLVPVTATAAAIRQQNAEMRRALSDIRRLCFIVSGLKDDAGKFIFNPLAERIGSLAGRAIADVRGRDAT